MQSAQFQLHAQFEQHHWWFLARSGFLRRLVHELLPPSRESPALSASNGLVIDIGCGTGANIAALANDYRTLGIDTSSEAIDFGATAIPRGCNSFTASPPPIWATQCGEAKLVLMMDVLEHVADDFALFSSIAAAMSPGALLMVTVPANQKLWNRHDESFGHYRRYDRQRLEQVWEGLPLEARLVSHFNARLYPLIKTVRAVNRLARQTAGAAGTDFALPPAPINWLLESVFAGEGRLLADSIHAHRPAYRNGVSLLAVLERKPGLLEVRSKPPAIAADYFDPAVL